VQARRAPAGRSARSPGAPRACWAPVQCQAAANAQPARRRRAVSASGRMNSDTYRRPGGGRTRGSPMGSRGPTPQGAGRLRRPRREANAAAQGLAPTLRSRRRRPEPPAAPARTRSGPGQLPRPPRLAPGHPRACVGRRVPCLRTQQCVDTSTPPSTPLRRWHDARGAHHAEAWCTPAPGASRAAKVPAGCRQMLSDGQPATRFSERRSSPRSNPTPRLRNRAPPSSAAVAPAALELGHDSAKLAAKLLASAVHSAELALADAVQEG